MIGIIDYGMGNLHSVQKAFEHVGAPVQIVTDAEGITAADKIVLPGVGAFRDAIDTLQQKQLIEPIQQAVKEGKWFLGICLGLQLLFDRSFEDGQYDGLGIVKGNVVRFDFTGTEFQDFKIPHMGWNALQVQGDVPLYRDMAQDSYTYFVHSYYVAPENTDVIATTTNYGIDFVSSIYQDNVMATQFHPEKSQQVGLKMLKNFSAL